MPPVSPAAQTPDPAEFGYAAEVRFGVVMYGGVSLAIYINGVTNELYEMACATPLPGFKLVDEAAAGLRSRDIYRRLSWLVGSEALRAKYADAIERATDGHDAWDGSNLLGAEPTRLVVDVIAGTSAGGINGIFLAKALANGEQFAPLRNMWINEGDIGLLLNDAKSYSSVRPPLDDRSKEPASLLNSDRMYAKLGEAIAAMKAMQVTTAGPEYRGSPLVEEIDLYVTTTDIEGSAVPLRLFDKVVYERRYKQSYHFNYPNGVTPSGKAVFNDFDASNNAFLAFAARCTSSFPFAFEPMTLQAVARLRADGERGLGQWDQFFPNLPRAEVAQGRHKDRAFGDGGYLDNKPFTYVVETLAQRYSRVPAERKLVYVEPSPEYLDPHRMPDADHPPDALSNSLAALTSIPQYESIREDLQAVLNRNRRIERVERLVRLGELDIAASDPLLNWYRRSGATPNWGSEKITDSVAMYGVAFLPYLRLRTYAVTDMLGDRLGARWGIAADSDQQYALRALVRVWREQRYNDDGSDGRDTVTGFLDQFDFDYRLRRLGFLLRRTDQLIRLLRKRSMASLDMAKSSMAAPSALSEVELQMVAQLPPPFTDLPVELDFAQVQQALAAASVLRTGLAAARNAMLAARRESLHVREGDSSDPASQGLRAELLLMLDLVLGQAPADGSVHITDAQRQAIAVVLKPEALKMASNSRTLQESVLFRARALMAAAAAARDTALQKTMERQLDDLRVKPGKAGPLPDVPQPSLFEINTWSGALLGAPAFAYQAETDTVVVSVEEVSERVASLDLGLALADVALLNTAAGVAMRVYLGDCYRRFDLFDQMSFPLYYDTGTGEPATVEVVRISPGDATSLIDEATDTLHRRKLSGTAFGNFGAFLDRRWRLNDIMWGRLDGAERLIEALLPMGDASTVTVRKELIKRAHLGILREALVPDGEGDLVDLMAQALAGGSSGATLEWRLRTLMGQLLDGDAVRLDKVKGMLLALLDEARLMEYVRNKRVVDPDPDPATTLSSVARATTITGRVLHTVSARRGVGTLAARWVARVGLMLQGVVAVSLPGTLRQRWWSHGVKVLYTFELVTLVAAVLLGSGDMRTLALSVFLLTLGAHFLTLVAGDYVRKRWSWLRLGLVLLLLVFFGLAVVGAVTLFAPAAQQPLCALTASGQLVCAR